jgi:hypothetical protein
VWQLSATLKDMAMSETFAATAAQTIPVFALAAVIELRFYEKLRPKKPSEWSQKAVEREIDKGLAYVAWSGVMLYLAYAEMLSIQRLNNEPIPTNASALVKGAFGAGLFLLVVLPVLSWPMSLQNSAIHWLVHDSGKFLRSRLSRFKAGPIEGHEREQVGSDLDELGTLAAIRASSGRATLDDSLNVFYAPGPD